MLCPSLRKNPNQSIRSIADDGDKSIANCVKRLGERKGATTAENLVQHRSSVSASVVSRVPPDCLDLFMFRFWLPNVQRPLPGLRIGPTDYKSSLIKHSPH